MTLKAHEHLSALQRVRLETIEECVKVCDEVRQVGRVHAAQDCASAIRSLSSKQQDKTHLGHLAVDLAGSAIAPSSCGSVPTKEQLIQSIKALQLCELDKIEEWETHNNAIDECVWMVETVYKQAALSTTGPMLQARTDAHDEGQPNEQNAVSAVLPAVTQAPAIPDELRVIGELLRTQNNRITDAPLFAVQQKKSYVTEDGYEDRHEWRETESGEYIKADKEEAEKLEAHYAAHYEEPKGWKRFCVIDKWEFVTACFTEQGCKDYLARNGHNLGETRIYAYGSYRNEEFRAVRKWLMSLAAPTTAPAQPTDNTDKGESL